ncbi:unnamed protein product [Caenorhabditis bovis]|uniref:Tyrosine-protein phosphatase domain-containing protein n=1 Tax=Caenorhabditis bovis TaxID=2654633 RepID=A0A8S1F4I8_9PELO|nr:unnamed protein product [Caenorhabditis bovis]
MSKANTKNAKGNLKNARSRSNDKTITDEKTSTNQSVKKGKKSKGSMKVTKLKKSASKINKSTKSAHQGNARSPPKKSKEEKTGLKTTNSIMNCSTKPAGKKEKWVGEEAAISWTNALSAVNMINDFGDLQKMPVNNERCKIWQTNMHRNRHPDYKIYDDNRVVIQMSKNDYINGSKINIPNFSRNTYLVQIPKLEMIDAVEEFWRMVFTEQCASVHILALPSELEKGFDCLFAQEAGGYLYANGFFINTRKVEKNASDKLDNYVVELLPEGCSNSVMCSVYIHMYWKQQGGPEKFHAPIKAAQMIAKNDIDNSPIAIVSVRGAGRNSALLTLAVIVQQFNKGMVPNIKEIVRTIREQRPLAVDSVTQYISLYLATCWLIKAKLPSNVDVQNKLKKFRTKCDPSSSQMSITTENH